MKALARREGRPKIFYGWYVVAACCAATLTLGETFWSFGVFFKPLENEFSWSRSTVSSAYTAFLVGYAFSAVAAGRLSDRYGPLPILLATAVSAGLGIALCSQVQSISQLRLLLLVAGLGSGATWSVPTSVVQRWFYGRPRAGLALAIVSSGVGLGAVIFAPLVNFLILGYGWRNAYLIVGILFFAIIALSSLVIKRSPSEAPVSPGEPKAPSRSVDARGWSTARAVATSSFLGITFAACAGMLSSQAVMVHLVPLSTDAGIDATVSAAALGLMGGFSVPGRILSGLISDRIGWQKTMAFSIFGMGLSIGWLLFLRSEWMLYSFVICYGLCHGSRNAAWLGILGEYFGMRSLGELIGLSSAIGQMVSALGPYLAGLAFDTTGSYLIAFAVVMALLLGGGFTATAIRPPRAASG